MKKNSGKRKIYHEKEERGEGRVRNEDREKEVAWRKQREKSRNKRAGLSKEELGLPSACFIKVHLVDTWLLYWKPYKRDFTDECFLLSLQILLTVLLGVVAADSKYRYVLPFYTPHYQPAVHAVVPQFRSTAVHHATPSVIQYRAPAAVQYSAPAAVQYRYHSPAVPTIAATTYTVRQYDDDDDDFYRSSVEIDDDDVKYVANPYSAARVRGRSLKFDDDDDDHHHYYRVPTTYAKFDDDHFDFDDHDD
ncbi:hypothetical protein Pcinc_007495 [Petrolisthes cinctipes]|uniref:Uncharacterized protein n=1 Tax=Petrolisthes cinctipes TaxID=88211 RepID=A0AAE1GB07_PETCI|nr:hypothetical protein Pcinc_007495 [Petrolisthes cinctipes]